MTNQTRLQLDDDDFSRVLDRTRRDAIQIDDIAIDEEFRRTPGDVAYWNERYSQALKRYLHAKLSRNTVRARLRMEIREEVIASGERATVEDLDAMVQLRDEFQQAELAYIETEAECESLKLFAEAVRVKKDMLQSLGAKLRVEMEGDPTIRQQHAGSRRYGT